MKVVKDIFDLIYMFNSFYAFPDQLKALEAIKKLSHKSTELIIFDYADSGNYNGECSEIPNPVKLDEIENILEKSGWQLINIEDISDYYIRCYISLCSKIEDKKDKIVEISNENIYEYVLNQFNKILDAHENSYLKGVILKALSVS